MVARAAAIAFGVVSLLITFTDETPFIQHGIVTHTWSQRRWRMRWSRAALRDGLMKLQSAIGPITVKAVLKQAIPICSLIVSMFAYHESKRSADASFASARDAHELALQSFEGAKVMVERDESYKGDVTNTDHGNIYKDFGRYLFLREGKIRWRITVSNTSNVANLGIAGIGLDTGFLQGNKVADSQYHSAVTDMYSKSDGAYPIYRKDNSLVELPIVIGQGNIMEFFVYTAYGISLEPFRSTVNPSHANCSDKAECDVFFNIGNQNLGIFWSRTPDSVVEPWLRVEVDTGRGGEIRADGYYYPYISKELLGGVNNFSE